MGLKKYEIITVGSDKRVRALRSWAVGDRYVNIGDVGGIVYDEKTLSQDGLCWLFKGNFGFPGARIGGDSIVDVGEATLSIAGSPAVDIVGSSVVVGSKLQFASELTAADIIVLTAADFEQGAFIYAAGANWETWKTGSVSNIRTKAPIFLGGVAATLKLNVPGYAVQAYVLDRDGIGIVATSTVNTGAGVTLSVPAGQYFMLRLAKVPTANIVPADATAAQITFTGTYETKLSIVDSRVEINPVTSTKISSIKPGGRVVGGSYPEAIIRNSKVSVNASAVADATARIMGQIIESNVTIDATAGEAQISGIYSNVKNLTVSGILSVGLGAPVYNAIQATDCDNFVTSPGVFPGYAAGISANVPFIFQGCNVPGGLFYHNAQIANTYKNIDFALVQSDLGKDIASGEILASSEVEGMYRVYSTTGAVFGALVEAYDSVKSLNMASTVISYGTTIYKDAYFNGLFDFAGTNVFGNTMKHDASNTQNVLAVQGFFNTNAVGGVITGFASATDRVVVAQPYRLMGAKGIEVVTPAGIESVIFLTDANSKIVSNTAWVSGTLSPNTAAATANVFAYVAFRKTGGTAAITPEDLAGVTVTVYNGCKIVNTGATAVNMKGNIRVEDNATLVNASVTGTGYFGGNSIASGLISNGCAFMDNNATLVKTSEGGTIRRLYMRDNSYAAISAVTVFGLLDLRENAIFSPISYGVSEADVIMRDNAVITSGLSVNGVVTMKDNAKVSSGTVTIAGDITLCGSYNQTANKTWTGKRVIDSTDAPTYDYNVKIQYDF